jgi:glycosyltransferase (activator-dependent family)
MRVLFTTWPEKTHFLAMVPLAWALRTAGHEVRVAVQPKFVDEITQAGLTAVPVGSDRDLWQLMDRYPEWIDGGNGGLPVPYDAAEWRREDIAWEYLHGGYEFQLRRWHRMSNVPMVNDLVAFALHWRPDLIIWEYLTYAGAIAAKACGAAHARLMSSPDILGITRDHYLRLNSQRRADERADPLAEWLSGYARRYGSTFSEDMVTGQFTIDQFPPSLRMHADLRYVAMRFVPYGGPAVVPEWLWSPPDRVRVALTLGLCNTEHFVGYTVDVQDILDAFAYLDIELVATIAESEQRKLDRVPDNARLVGYVPLQALVPTCAAVIHHAGFGTLCTTAAHAVPQLVLPFDYDEPSIARRLVDQGTALAVHASEATGKTVREHLTRLLSDPTFRQSAGRLRDEMLALPTPNELVGHLEELVTEYRGAAGPPPR